MLPDFPRIKQQIHHTIQKAIAASTTDPLLSLIPKETLNEGHVLATGDVHGTTRTTELKHFTTWINTSDK